MTLEERRAHARAALEAEYQRLVKLAERRRRDARQAAQLWAALNENGGNITVAARALGVSRRTTYDRMERRYRIARQRPR